MPRIKIDGLHSHIGRDVHLPAHWRGYARDMIKMAAAFRRETGVTVSIVDLGGGFSEIRDPSGNDLTRVAAPIEEYARETCQGIREGCAEHDFPSSLALGRTGPPPGGQHHSAGDQGGECQEHSRGGNLGAPGRLHQPSPGHRTFQRHDLPCPARDQGQGPGPGKSRSGRPQLRRRPDSVGPETAPPSGGGTFWSCSTWALTTCPMPTSSTVSPGRPRFWSTVRGWNRCGNGRASPMSSTASACPTGSLNHCLPKNETPCFLEVLIHER